ncbi:MAG TPA: hypothetical protein DDW27_19980 [Bacteroidales bacterium]|nr:hypothetical protein [Bacteroidales bacterium]
MELVSLMDLRRYPIVTNVEITKAPRTIMQVPTILHSVLTGSVGSAISQRARNIKISAIADRAPRMIVMVVETLSFFINTDFM